MKENYYALTVCILRNCTPEQAFHLLNTGKKKRYREDIKDSIPEMIRLKEQGMTYKAIGEMFGVSKDAIYTRIRRATGRLTS